MSRSSLLLFESLLLVFALRLWGGDDTWEERFRKPPADARILKIIHNWPDATNAQDALISRLSTQGFGGVVCNVSFDKYLESETKWQAFTRAVNAARQAGFALWLYDERGYPSGNAGGLTMRNNSEWEARGLLVADTESKGGAVDLELPPGKLVLAGAFPIVNGQSDLQRKVDLSPSIATGKLKWHAPEGHWKVMVITEHRLYEGTHADGNLHEKIPYINLLMPEPTARFVELTYGGYAKHLGSNLGEYFMASFTDEPSLMSLFLKPMPYRPLPWSQGFPAEFKKRRGYALADSTLPALIAEAGPGTARTRHDFWLTVGELVSENFFGQIQTRCRDLKVPSGGHLLMEESIVGHVPLYGDFFRCIRRLDAPSIDCLTSLPGEVPWFIARLLSSAAELNSQPIVMSETSDHAQHYRPAGDQRPRRVVTEAEIRGTCNRLIVAGVNSITSYYSFSELSEEQLRRINEYVGRCCAMLRGGSQVADIAVVYPAESLWTKFIPSQHLTRQASEAARIENSLRTTIEGLFAAQRDFTFVDSQALIEAQVKAGVLAHNQLRWRVVILPGIDTLPTAAWDKLERFAASGGVVIGLGARPANSETEFPSRRVQGIAANIFGRSKANGPAELLVQTNASGGIGLFLPRGLEALVPAVLNGIFEPDCKVTDTRSPLRVAHRRIAEHDVYFLVNDSPGKWSGNVSLCANDDGEHWNPATGLKERTVAARNFTLSLDPYGSALFRFSSARTPQRLSAGNAPLPNLVFRSLPEIEPNLIKGEFVQGRVTWTNTFSTTKTHGWDAAAKLTKGQVDTFLFLNFKYLNPLDLGDVNCITLESFVPDDQSTPSQLLVILHEENGGDFLAESGRSLSGPGRETSFISLNQFRLAGWSKDADGVLDPSRISEIRVGWGGYFGSEDEKVRFSLGPLQAGKVIGNSSSPTSR